MSAKALLIAAATVSLVACKGSVVGVIPQGTSDVIPDPNASQVSPGDGGSDTPAGDPDTSQTDGAGDASVASGDDDVTRPLSYMIGHKTAGTDGAPQTIEGWLGRPIDVIGGAMTTTAWINDVAFQTQSGAYPLHEVSFPLLSIFGEAPTWNNMTDMAEAAAGTYDGTYAAMAQALASWPNPLLSARIGWEFNGNWYPWSNGVGTNATHDNYVAAFKRAAILIRQYNPHVLIQWCVAWGADDPMPYWPGAYDPETNPGGVDVVSMDFYQGQITQYDNGGVQSPFSMVQSAGSVNLDWLTQFALSQGVKVALSEYAPGAPNSAGDHSGPGLDDGQWMADVIAWINQLPPGLFLWNIWSNDAPSDDLVTPGANPSEQAAWISAYKATHFAGSWWTGATAP